MPRYRQRLAFVPLGQGRPNWVDDPHLNLRYHVRSTALPSPGSEEQLKDLAGRVFAQQLDRDKPLWELWLVEGLEGDRFALLAKTHHALVDGDLRRSTSSPCCSTPPPSPPRPPTRATAGSRARSPSRAQLLGEALRRARDDPGRGRPLGARRAPRPAPRARRASATPPWASAPWRGPGSTPRRRTPYNEPIGPHRRFTWVRADLARPQGDQGRARRHGQRRGAGHRGRARSARHLRRRGQDTDGLELKAMVPVSVRSDVERGALGNRVAAMMAPLPVWCQEPVARLDIVRQELKRPEVGRPGGRRPGAHRADRLRAADDHGPGRPADARASASSTWS